MIKLLVYLFLGHHEPGGLLAVEDVVASGLRYEIRHERVGTAGPWRRLHTQGYEHPLCRMDTYDAGNGIYGLLGTLYGIMCVLAKAEGRSGDPDVVVQFLDVRGIVEDHAIHPGLA